MIWNLHRKSVVRFGCGDGFSNSQPFAVDGFLARLFGMVDWSAAIIIPKAEPIKENIAAIVKPFQFWVDFRILWSSN